MILDILNMMEELRNGYTGDFQFDKANAISVAMDGVRKIEREYHAKMHFPHNSDRSEAEIVAGTNVH